MKNPARIRTGLVAALWIFMGTHVMGQGSLTPPGAPGETMHTLEEIYQRLEANQATLEANQEAIEARLEAIEQQAASEVPEGMVLIPAGDFVMGDTFGEGDSDELPVHSVTVSAFYMGETEVTKTQWEAVHSWAVTNGYAFENAGLGKAGNHPVHTVNWYDCVKWANARSEMEGLSPCYLAETTTGTIYRAGDLAPTVDRYASGYRLPTEADWKWMYSTPSSC